MQDHISHNVHIDPKELSDSDYQVACAVLNASIRRLLKDPKKRAEFEEWKKKRREAGL